MFCFVFFGRSFRPDKIREAYDDGRECPAAPPCSSSQAVVSLRLEVPLFMSLSRLLSFTVADVITVVVISIIVDDVLHFCFFVGCTTVQLSVAFSWRSSESSGSCLLCV